MTKLLSVFMILCFTLPAMAGSSLDVSHLKDIPVLHDGRVKPLDSFARIHKKLITGSQHNAMAWLIGVMMVPDQAVHDPVFKVKSEDLKTRLMLPARDTHRYSLLELNAGFAENVDIIEALYQMGSADLSRDQRALLELHTKKLLYSQLVRSLSVITPLSLAPPEEFNLHGDTPPTLIDFWPHHTEIKTKARAAHP